MKIARLILLGLMIVAPTVPMLSSAPQQDVPGEVGSAKQALQNAYKELEHAGSNWGGHRENAMKHIQEALTELNAAEKYAQEHHDMK